MPCVFTAMPAGLPTPTQSVGLSPSSSAGGLCALLALALLLLLGLPRVQRGAGGGVENLYTVVALVADEERVLVVHRHVGRMVKLPLSAALRAEGAQKVALKVEDLDPVARIGDQDLPPAVHRDVQRRGEPALLRALEPELA
eukprot:CAMPEP_0175734110 /NCGR_PEP_ID=MMETSP0097-20121207/52225_1 /TAXON_ID=311494 /ORGANISM="Alexandrium monilatum, Strain CCMP3105" /LENGTH=141 /DNA_ID=CAMNT_0017042143 /DNA_START=33 /DNA_END=455 /DNA_ORIENTATION=-